MPRLTVLALAAALAAGCSKEEKKDRPPADAAPTAPATKPPAKKGGAVPFG